MVDALALKGDEGRGVAAIRFGEVPSNLRSGDVRMGKPSRKRFLESLAREMHTLGSETSQYQEEKKPNSISLVAASERESSPNRRDSQTTGSNTSGTRNSRGCKAVIVALSDTKLQIVR